VTGDLHVDQLFQVPCAVAAQSGPDALQKTDRGTSQEQTCSVRCIPRGHSLSANERSAEVPTVLPSSAMERFKASSPPKITFHFVTEFSAYVYVRVQSFST
jgi:hypothetical protein